uniref:RING-type E3 ubiquitin transferase n=2 Tax=Auxenochlorella protothecoides TaxID=3075 RepID=A0A1D2AFC5_AUXPR
MKFARYIQGLEHDCPPEWAGKFLRYKELKKLLKPLSSEQSQENGGPEAGEQALGPAPEHDEEVFFSTLRAQMKVVDRQFQKQAWATITAFERSQFRSPALCFLCVFRWRTADKNSRLAQQAYWCMKFAKANAVALRKILKKHDKVARNLRGRQFLQESWQPRGTEGVGIFLHSPLLDELKAIQDWLYEQGPKPADTPEDEVRLSAAGTLSLDEEEAREELAEEAERGADPGARGLEAVAVPGASPGGVAAASLGSGPSEDGEGAGDAGADWGLPPQPEDAGAERGPERVASFPPPPRLRPLAVAGGACPPTTPKYRGRGGAGPLRPSAAPSFVTTSSLRLQRDEGLAAICESPSFLLDSSDVEWEGLSPTARSADSRALSAILSEPSGAASSAPRSAGRPGGEGPYAVASGPTPAPGAARSSGGDAARPRTRFREADLACPICLEVMYKPVGLVCGHKFCKRCVLEAAGFGRAMGTFSSIVSHVPRRSVCPECRQPDVYRGAVSLREVGKLIAARHPQAWAERRREDRERERAAADRMLNETMDSYRPVLRASSVYELLF